MIIILKKEFKDNLINTVLELGIDDYNTVKFIVIPIYEENKKLNSTDDWMRLGILNTKNLGKNKFSLDIIVNMLSGPNSTFPLWITAQLIEKKESNYVIELRTSLRFRTPSVLQNQETGHPPFKAIKNEHDK